MDASQYKKGKEKGKGWTCDLIPKALVVARTFAPAQAAIDQLAAELDKVNKAEVTRRLREVGGGSDRSVGSDG